MIAQGYLDVICGSSSEQDQLNSTEQLVGGMCSRGAPCHAPAADWPHMAISSALQPAKSLPVKAHPAVCIMSRLGYVPCCAHCRMPFGILPLCIPWLIYTVQSTIGQLG